MPEYDNLFHKTTGGKPGMPGGPLRPDLLRTREKKPAQMQKLVYKLQTAVDAGILETASPMEVDMIHEQIFGQVKLSFRGWLWGESLGRATIVYPADWWQAFKERWFPGFLRGRYPVIYNVREIDVKAIYPRLRNRMLYPDIDHTIHVDDKGYTLDELFLIKTLTGTLE